MPSGVTQSKGFILLYSSDVSCTTDCLGRAALQRRTAQKVHRIPHSFRKLCTMMKAKQKSKLGYAVAYKVSRVACIVH